MAYDDSIDGIIAAVRDRYLALSATNGAIYREPDARTNTETEALRVITAIVLAGCHEETWGDDMSPHIIELCTKLENGYGCWLDTIRQAVATVDLSFTDDPTIWTERIEGARRGIFPLIFSLNHSN